MFKILIFISLFLLVAFNLHAATIFDAEWDLGTTCNATNLNTGIWTSADISDCASNLGIGTGGPGGRNYLQLKYPSSDLTSYLRGATSLGNPQNLYVRFWFRLLSTYTSENNHPMFIGQSDGMNYGFALFRGTAHTNTFSMFTSYGDHVYWYQPGVSLNTWYRLEYRIQGGGTSTGTVTVRLDGVDVTSSFLSDSNGTTLTSRNGSLAIETLNYPYFATYLLGGPTGELIDIAGFTMSNSDWLGSDADTTAPNVTISTTNPSRITGATLTVVGTSSDAVGVSSCKYRLLVAPDASNGTICTGTTSFTCNTTGYSLGSNTLYVGCNDAAGNWGSASIVVNKAPMYGIEIK